MSKNPYNNYNNYIAALKNQAIWWEVNGDAIDKIVSLVQQNPEFFDARLGGNCLDFAANKLENLVSSTKTDL